MRARIMLYTLRVCHAPSNLLCAAGVFTLCLSFSFFLCYLDPFFLSLVRARAVTGAISDAQRRQARSGAAARGEGARPRAISSCASGVIPFPRASGEKKNIYMRRHGRYRRPAAFRRPRFFCAAPPPCCLLRFSPPFFRRGDKIVGSPPKARALTGDPTASCRRV